VSRHTGVLVEHKTILFEPTSVEGTSTRRSNHDEINCYRVPLIHQQKQFCTSALSLALYSIL